MLKYIIGLGIVATFIVTVFSFYAKKGPWCAPELEICNRLDDDCDNQIDEDKACEILPDLSPEGVSILRSPIKVTSIELSEGYFVEAAHDHLLIFLEKEMSDAKLDSLLKEISNLDLLIIGQSPKLNMLQLRSQTPDSLVNQLKELSELEGVDKVSLDQAY